MTGLTCLLLLFLSAPSERAALDVRADRLELDHRAGVVRFEGAVVATQGAFELRCERLEARYGQDGGLSELKAEGSLSVKSDGMIATASRAQYTRADDRLELTGEPKVIRGETELKGAKMTFFPKSGRLLVEAARGRLPAPRLVKSAP